MFEIELRCRDDRPQMRHLLTRWVGVQADVVEPRRTA